jgi:hypothetical protein
MASPQWRDRFRNELLRQRLPRDYISRLLEELSDHAADLSKEISSMDVEKRSPPTETQRVDDRLGNPEHLASLARSEYQRRTFAGRHPLITFIAGPVFAVVGTFLAVCLVACGIVWGIDLAAGGVLSANDKLDLPPTPFEMTIVQGFSLVIRFFPFVVSAWLFARLGRRTGLRAWSVAACGVIALVAVCFVSVCTPATAQAKAMWMIGFGLKFGLDQIVQAAVPFALGAWLIWRHRAHDVPTMAV